jgi:hypothetical protein
VLQLELPDTSVLRESDPASWSKVKLTMFVKGDWLTDDSEARCLCQQKGIGSFPILKLGAMGQSFYLS